MYFVLTMYIIWCTDFTNCVAGKNKSTQYSVQQQDIQHSHSVKSISGASQHLLLVRASFKAMQTALHKVPTFDFLELQIQSEKRSEMM